MSIKPTDEFEGHPFYPVEPGGEAGTPIDISTWSFFQELRSRCPQKPKPDQENSLVNREVVSNPSIKGWRGLLPSVIRGRVLSSIPEGESKEEE